MSLTWNEVRDRAIRFSREWTASSGKERDKQSFWDAFFDIFSVPRSSVATLEHVVANARGSYGVLHLFQPGVMLVEHKSRKASLAKAESQAFAYSPASATDKQRAEVEACAQLVLDARAKAPQATLADHYDPLSMPPAFAKAHAAHDRAVDRCYRSKPLACDRERTEPPFAFFEQLTSPLAPAEATKARSPRRRPGADRG